MDNEFSTGQKLVNLRQRAGVTQEELAKALKVTSHTIRNWEKGRAEPELQIWQVKMMCTILGCTLDELPDRFKVD